MAGSTAEIGIRVYLEDAAQAELDAITNSLKTMASAAKSASAAIQQLSDALDSLNGGAVEEVASAMDAGATAVDDLKASEADLGATEAELATVSSDVSAAVQEQAQSVRDAAAAQEEEATAADSLLASESGLGEMSAVVASSEQEVAAAMQESAQAAEEGVSSVTDLASAQAALVTTLQSQVDTLSEDSAATQEDASSTLSLEEARAQLLSTLQAELDAESIGIQMMQDIAAEEQAASAATDELATSAQTVQERVLGANDGMTQFNVSTQGVAGEVKGLVPVLDEAGNATGAWAYVSGLASEKVQALRTQGQGLLASVLAQKEATDGARASQDSWISSLANGINEYIALGFVLQMVAGYMGQFISLGAGIADSMNVIQGMTGVADAQMQQWSNDIATLDDQFGMLETDSVPALGLITRAGYQGADATTVLSDAMLLADSSGQTMAESTQAMTLAMDIFNLSAGQGRQVSLDFFNALSESTLPLTDYISLLDQSGLTAKALGINVDDLITTVGNLGKSMGGSSITVRDFQTLLAGLVTFTQLSSDAIAKLAGSFNLTTYAAQNSVGRFLDLAQASNGSEQALLAMIGGVRGAQTALDALGISTKQLVINAANLGLSFDPVKYNALDAAGKLLYLAQIADYSKTTFDALTKGGLQPATAAFLTIEGAMDAAAQHLASLTPHFDLAAFNAADLSQKLHMLADYLGGPNSPEFAKYVGGTKNVAMAIYIMNQEADKTPGHMQHINQALDTTSGFYRKMMGQVDNATQDMQAQFNKQDTSAQRVANDAQHQTQAINAAWQHVSQDFVTQFGPLITGVLHNVDQSFVGMGHQSNIGVALAWAPFPGFEEKIAQFSQWFGNEWSKLFNFTLPSAVRSGNVRTDAEMRNYTQTVQNDFNKGGIDWGNVLKNFFTQTVPQIFGMGFILADNKTKSGTSQINATLNSGGQSWYSTIGHWLLELINPFSNFSNVVVGHSIIPDMVAAVTATFQRGGTAWQVVISSATNNMISVLSSLPGRALSIVEGMIANVAGALQRMSGGMYSSGLNAAWQFANGIAAGAGGAIQAAWSIANAVAGILAHHSPPKEGPMKDDDTWMPNMMHMLTQGIEQNIPTFKMAVTGVAAGAAGSFASVPQVARMSGPTAVGGAVAGGGNTTVPLVVDGQVLASVVINRITGQMQMNGLGRAFR